MHTNQKSSFSPVEQSARIDIMDILRGFALVGIVFMNIEWFNRSSTEIRSFDTSLTGLDHAVGWLIRAFVEGKFYKLFALLFGMGFAVMLLRAKEAGKPFFAWFSRRMLVLLLIGLAHNTLIWDGDILHDYAFGGLVFLVLVSLFQARWLRRFSTPSAFLKIGLIWLALPFVVITVSGITLGTTSSHDDIRRHWQFELGVADGVKQRLEQPDVDDELSADQESAPIIDDSELSVTERKANEIVYWTGEIRSWAREEAEQVRIMSGDSYLAAVRYRAANLPQDAAKTLFFTSVLLLPIFLIGYWFVASGVLRRHAEHRRLYQSLAVIGLFFGTMFSVAGLLMQQHPLWDISESMGELAFWAFNLGQLVLAAGYLGLIVMLAGKPAAHRVLKALAPYGRMALTNYILQSIVLVLLFHGYAGGLYGEVSRSSQMLIVVAIVATQMLFSAWWLGRFRFGPLEWLWRSATYLAWQPLKR